MDWLITISDRYTLSFTITIYKKVNLRDSCHRMIINCFAKKKRQYLWPRTANASPHEPRPERDAKNLFDLEMINFTFNGWSLSLVNW